MMSQRFSRHCHAPEQNLNTDVVAFCESIVMHVMNYKNSDFLHPPNPSYSEDKIIASSPSSSVFDLPLGSYNPPPSSQDKTVENNATAPDVDYLEPIRSSLLVISGGTGANSLCAAFGSDACYVLPVSDDGGSSSEIIRVIGTST